LQHMTAERGLRPARMPWSICREMPRVLAAAVVESPAAGSTSCLRISPGWTGGRALWRGALRVVVFKVNLHGGFAGPGEGYAVIGSDAQGPTFRGALQTVELEAGEVAVIRGGGDFE
jgi:hypothetical protein